MHPSSFKEQAVSSFAAFIASSRLDSFTRTKTFNLIVVFFIYIIKRIAFSQYL